MLHRRVGVGVSEVKMATKLKAKAPAEVKPGHSKILLYGGPGSGKSWFALSFPSVYYVDTEGGAQLQHYTDRLKQGGGVYFGPNDGAGEFETILSEVQTLATEKHPYRTLVIDSITKVYQSRIARESERLGEKDAFGASKKPAIAQMRRLVSWLPKLDMNVVLVAHDVSLWGGDGKDRKQIGTGPDAWEKLAFELDLTLKVTKAGPGVRRAQVDKSRLTGFPEFSEFYLQEAGKDVGYKNFAERYGKDYIEAAAVPVVLATPAQVAEIERLVALLKLDAEEIEKIMTRANAEKWSEFTTEQAEKTVEFFKKKIEGASA